MLKVVFLCFCSFCFFCFAGVFSEMFLSFDVMFLKYVSVCIFFLFVFYLIFKCFWCVFWNVFSILLGFLKCLVGMLFNFCFFLFFCFFLNVVFCFVFMVFLNVGVFSVLFCWCVFWKIVVLHSVFAPCVQFVY